MKKDAKNNSGEIYLVLDLRSSSIGAGVFKNFYGRGTLPIVLKTFRKRIFFEEKVNGTEFLNKSKLILKEVLAEIINKNNNFGKIDKVRVMYASPWYKTEIKKIIKTEDIDQLFNNDYLKDLLRLYKKQKPDQENYSLEKKILNFKLNDYCIENPINKQFNKIEVDFYESIANKETQDQIRELILSFVDSSDIKFNTHPFVFYKVLNSKFEKLKNYVIFDIGGEMSEMIIVRENDFQNIISVPYGTHYFAREIMKKCNFNTETAFSQIDQITSKKKISSLMNSTEIVFKEIRLSWLKIFGQILTDFNIKSLPTDFFISTEKNTEKLILNLINDPNAYAGYLKINQKPRISLFNSDEITDLCHYRQGVQKDPIVSLAANFFEITE